MKKALLILLIVSLACFTHSCERPPEAGLPEFPEMKDNTMSYNNVDRELKNVFYYNIVEDGEEVRMLAFTPEEGVIPGETDLETGCQIEFTANVLDKTIDLTKLYKNMGEYLIGIGVGWDTTNIIDYYSAYSKDYEELDKSGVSEGLFFVKDNGDDNFTVRIYCVVNGKPFYVNFEGPATEWVEDYEED